MIAKKLTLDDVIIHVNATHEQISPREYMNCEKNQQIVNEFVQDIHKMQINADEDWGWCSIEVTIKIKNLDCQATQYLGCCSYLSKEDFIQKSGYYQQMVNDAMIELQKNLVELIENLENYVLNQTHNS